MRRVLYYAQLTPRRDLVEALHVERKTGEMDGHDGPGARRDRGLNLSEINVARIQAHVDEDGPRAHANDHIGCSDEAQGRRDDLIARPDTAGAQRHLHARGRRRLGSYRPATEILCELIFERGYFRAGREPSRAQHFDDGLDRLLVKGG